MGSAAILAGTSTRLGEETDENGNPISDPRSVPPRGVLPAHLGEEVDENGNPVGPFIGAPPAPPSSAADREKIWRRQVGAPPMSYTQEELVRDAKKARNAVTDVIPMVAGGAAAMAAGPGVVVPALAAGVAGAAGVPLRELVKTLTSQRSVKSGTPLAKDAATEFWDQAIGTAVGGGIAKGANPLLRRTGMIPPTPRAGAESLAVEAGIPFSDPATGPPLRRPSNGILAQWYGNRQQGQVVEQATQVANPELVRAGAAPITDVPPSPASLVRATDRSIQARALANKRGGTTDIGMTKAVMLEKQAAELRAVEAQVRARMGRPAVEAADLGADIRKTASTARGETQKRLGNEIEKAMDPIRGRHVDAREMFEELDHIAQQDTPLVKGAKAELEALRVPDTKGNPTDFVNVDDLERYSQKYGSLRRYNPTRTQGPANSVRDISDRAITGLFDTEAERKVFAAAKQGYARGFGDVYTRGVMKSQLSPANAQTPADMTKALLSPRTLGNPKRARIIWDSLGTGPEADAVKAQMKANVLDSLFAGKGGVRGTPEKWRQVHPHTGRLIFGAADAQAVDMLVRRVPQLRARLKLPEGDTVAAEQVRLTSPRLLALQEALKANWKPTSSTGAGISAAGRATAAGAGAYVTNPTLAATALIVSELHGLLRTIVAYHPQGGLANFNRALGTMLTGSARPMGQFLGALAARAQQQEGPSGESTSENQEGEK